jgi:hypothetical protein
MVHAGLTRKESPVWGDGIITSLHVYGEEMLDVIGEARRLAPDHPIPGCRRAAEILFTWIERFGVSDDPTEIGEYEGEGGAGKITAWVEKLADNYDTSYYCASLFRVSNQHAIVWHVVVSNPRQHRDTWIADEIRRTRKALMVIR